MYWDGIEQHEQHNVYVTNGYHYHCRGERQLGTNVSGGEETIEIANK